MDDQRRTVRVERYFPNVLAPAKEFKMLAQMEDDEFAALWNEAWQWFCNTFVNYINVAGAERWEDMLGIIVPPGSTLEDRKAAILLRINTQLPYTIRKFQELINAAYGENMIIASTNKQYELWFDIDNAVILRMNELRIWARSIIPANLTIKIQQMMTSNIHAYAGGKVSCYKKIKIGTNTDFALPDFNIHAYAGGKVSVIRKLRLETEEV